MSILIALLLAAGLAPETSGRDHVGLAASAEFPSGMRDGDVVVRFMPLDPAVQVNAEPAPRLTLDPGQRVLAESARRAPPVTRQAFPNGRYLDPQAGVRFPVRLLSGAGRGAHVVKGTLTYFYCSTSAGWCRRALDEVEINVDAQ